ncbi:MAG: SEL1-like repeat protein, partial [Thermoguttaceae bacterium]|nr:SEL1-like repeat protein [Thermoguttaceae bacterium]
MSDVVKRLRNDDAQFKMLIVDACREPAATARAFGGRPRSFSNFDASGLAFLQSCGSKELSWEHPEVGGVFTHFFCEGLRGAAARDNGGVTFLDACGYASRETQRFVADRRAAEQTPFFTFSGVVDFYLKSPEIEPESVKEAEAERLYREGRALAFGLNRTKIDWQRGLELLTQAMEAGSMEAQAEISELFVGGGWEGARIDYQRAYELSAEPARLGNPFALVALGDVAYNAGYPDDRKEYRAEAFEGFKKLAEEGDVRAMNYLGRGFWAGWNGDVDFERAFEWTKKAADLGSVDAIANVGLAFIDGVGVERDFEQAKKYFREAAELNSAWAARALGHCYCHENNFGEAIQWLEIADKGNDSLAAVTLAELYDEGKGVEKDVEKATEFYRRGANLGNAAAKNALARRYAEGIGVEKSLREAERWFAAADNRKERFEVCLQAANEGEKWAPYFVGQCYEKNDGVRMDLKAMAYWYRRGAEMEDLKAMRAYAYCCEYGYGVKLDYEEMLRLYRKGAELGHGMSAVGMGVCYEEGKGVEIDLGESAKWYAQAMKS